MQDFVILWQPLIESDLSTTAQNIHRIFSGRVSYIKIKEKSCDYKVLGRAENSSLADSTWQLFPYKRKEIAII